MIRQHHTSTHLAPCFRSSRTRDPGRWGDSQRHCHGNCDAFQRTAFVVVGTRLALSNGVSIPSRSGQSRCHARRTRGPAT